MLSLGKCRFCKKRKAVSFEYSTAAPICHNCLEETKENNNQYLESLSYVEREETEFRLKNWY